MIFRHSLRSRIVIAFCLFGAILGIVYAVGIYMSLDWIDDYLINSRLNDEADYFIAQYHRYNDYPRITSPYISVYVGTESMPLYVVDMIDGFAEGTYEAYSGEEEYHIAIKKLQGQGTFLYLLYEVGALEFTEKRKLGICLVLIAGVIFIVGLGLWIGWFTSRKVIAPVVHLSDLVNKSGPQKLPTDLSKTFYDDEVGILAKTLEQAMQRVETFVEREHQFSQYASHELRTPVTIIKGAVVLLKQKFSNNEDPALRPLHRIERAVNNMQNIIETLLWLSREESVVKQGRNFAVVPVVRDIIEQNRYLTVNKPIDIEFMPTGDPQLSIPIPIFQIVLVNLIRNAIQHIASGEIHVIVKDDRVIVSDTGEGMEADDVKRIAQSPIHGTRSKGFGLGLSIVKRLCDRLDWELILDSEPGRGTTVHVIFRTNET